MEETNKDMIDLGSDPTDDFDPFASDDELDAEVVADTPAPTQQPQQLTRWIQPLMPPKLRRPRKPNNHCTTSCPALNMQGPANLSKIPHKHLRSFALLNLLTSPSLKMESA